MNWTGKHRAFTMETFIKTNESVTATQRAFHVHFKLGRHDPVPSRNTKDFVDLIYKQLNMVLFIKFLVKIVLVKTKIYRQNAELVK